MALSIVMIAMLGATFVCTYNCPRKTGPIWSIVPAPRPRVWPYTAQWRGIPLTSQPARVTGGFSLSSLRPLPFPQGGLRDCRKQPLHHVLIGRGPTNPPTPQLSLARYPRRHPATARRRLPPEPMVHPQDPRRQGPEQGQPSGVA